MKTILKYLITAFFVVNITIFTAHATTWRLKPVQCGTLEEVKELLDHNEEWALLGAIGNTSLNEDYPEELSPVPVYWFYNEDTGSFTIIEFHFFLDEGCVIQFGNGVDFDVRELFIPKKEPS